MPPPETNMEDIRNLARALIEIEQRLARVESVQNEHEHIISHAPIPVQDIGKIGGNA